MKHIAIIGGGFSGTLAAINLVRLSRGPLRISLLNRSAVRARGVAYGTSRPEHLLNVAARNMSALPDHPNHFLDWLRTRVDFATRTEIELRETFIPRRIYGDYLGSLALHYLQPADRRSEVEVRFVEDEAVHILPQGSGAMVELASGATLPADKVLLATGNEPPAPLPGSDSLAEHPAWCGNPWLDWTSRLPAETEPIVLLGTGLTTVDAVVTLLALGWGGTIHAVSRHGLLPEAHFKGIDYPEFPPVGVDLAALGLERLRHLLEEHGAELRGRGANPAIIVDKMRPQTQRVWQRFSLEERREFCRVDAARWNVLRHRIAPSISEQVAAAQESGRLQIARGSVAAVRAVGARVEVELLGPDGRTETLSGGLVINGTGPHTRFSRTGSRLLRSLLASGLAQPDELDMGVRVEDDFALLEGGGVRSQFLFAIGPLLRGTLWESVAVPELRSQALRVAQTLLDECRRSGQAGSRWAARPEEAVLEYAI